MMLPVLVVDLACFYWYFNSLIINQTVPKPSHFQRSQHDSTHCVSASKQVCIVTKRNFK